MKQRQMELTQESVAKRGLIRDGIHFPYNPNNLQRAKAMRKNMTPAESKLWFAFLHKHEYRFYRQRPIDHFIVDFYCSKADLVIEVDGDTHAGDEVQDYDRMRTDLLNLYGLRVIRFTNQQIYTQLNDVCRCIVDYLDHRELNERI